MIEGIPWNILGDISGWAVAFVFVYFIARGKLVPRSALDDIRGVADTWREAWTTAMSTIKERDGQDAELIENSRTTVKVLKTLQAQAERPAAPSESEDSS